jgi:hypothetical protein
MQQQQVQFEGSFNGRCVDELKIRIDTTFVLFLCLSTNTISSFGWYVDSGASRHMTYDINIFNVFQ